MTSKQFSQVTWRIALNPDLLKMAKVDPEELSLLTLFTYIKQLHHHHNQTQEYALAFYKRLCQPLATCVMMLLAIPFIFGSLRSATMGLRIIIGCFVGFGFYILNQFVGPISLVYQLPASFAAVFPTLLFMLLALLMMRYVR